MRDLQTLMRRAVAMAGAVATLGLAQFVTGMLFINYVQLPGLTTNVPLFAVSDRGGLNRPPGTAIHPIEFGSLLTMILPIALHLAMTDRSRTLLRRWYPVGVIAVAIPIAISRSAILSALVVLVVLLPTWSTRVRRRAYLIIIALVGALFVTIPGLIGTITRLFTGISGDSSAQSRTDSYHIAFEFISRNPIVGRGFMTFLPAYRILDNQYLGLLIDAGILGLTSYLLLLASGIYTAVRIRRNSSNADIRGIAQAFAASIASAAASFALFDAFSFPMAGGTLMFVMGLTGALARITWMNRDTVTVRYGNGARKRRVAP
ncbi:MAG TPA: O-antigen ligase family protein [Jatrophihabitans sp.]